MEMLNKIGGFLMLMASGMLMAATVDWPAIPGKLIAGQRVGVEHKGKLDRGIYALSNANEIVITQPGNGFLSIPQAEVDRVILQGTDMPKLSYFGNAHDQLFPKHELVYERNGAPATTRKR
jgi:hypothetical protein